MEQDLIRMTVRLPVKVAKFLDKMAEDCLTSRNSEIIRSIRDRMNAAGGEFSDQAPAANETTALQGGSSITQG